MKRSIASAIEGWLEKGLGRNPPAIILGSSVNALSFARSLGRRCIPTLLLDSEQLLGGYTRYGEFILLPQAEEDSNYCIEVLEFIASRLDTRAVLFATTDAHCLLVSRQRDRLRPHFDFILPDAEVVEWIVNKRSQYDRAQAAGIPIPKTYFPESVEEVKQLSSDLSYPCLLKPYISHPGRKKLSNKKVQLVHSATELISAFARLMASGQPFMAQEIVPGEDNALYGYLAFWDANAHELAWVTKQKLRQYPPQYGDGSLQMTVEAPEVAELSLRLLRAFNYSGFVGVEFKLDARDSSYRLIEINPRTVSGNQLAISAGIDFPWIGYAYLTGSMPATLPPCLFRPGVKCVNEEWDIQAYFALRKSGGLSFWQWLQSLRGAKTAIGAWDDPLPLFVGFWRLLKISCSYLKSAIQRMALKFAHFAKSRTNSGA